MKLIPLILFFASVSGCNSVPEHTPDAEGRQLAIFKNARGKYVVTSGNGFFACPVWIYHTIAINKGDTTVNADIRITPFACPTTPIKQTFYGDGYMPDAYCDTQMNSTVYEVNTLAEAKILLDAIFRRDARDYRNVEKRRIADSIKLHADSIANLPKQLIQKVYP